MPSDKAKDSFLWRSLPACLREGYGHIHGLPFCVCLSLDYPQEEAERSPRVMGIAGCDNFCSNNGDRWIYILSGNSRIKQLHPLNYRFGHGHFSSHFYFSDPEFSSMGNLN